MYRHVSVCILKYHIVLSCIGLDTGIARPIPVRLVSPDRYLDTGIARPIPGRYLVFFCDRYFACICVYLEGLFDTHRYLTLIGYFKIPPNTTKYFWGNTDPTFGGNLTQARRRPYARRPDRVYMYCVSPEGRRSGHSVSELQLQPRRRGGATSSHSSSCTWGV